MALSARNQVPAKVTAITRGEAGANAVLPTAVARR